MDHCWEIKFYHPISIALEDHAIEVCSLELDGVDLGPVRFFREPFLVSGNQRYLAVSELTFAAARGNDDDDDDGDGGDDAESAARPGASATLCSTIIREDLRVFDRTLKQCSTPWSTHGWRIEPLRFDAATRPGQGILARLANGYYRYLNLEYFLKYKVPIGPDGMEATRTAVLPASGANLTPWEIEDIEYYHLNLTEARPVPRPYARELAEAVAQKIFSRVDSGIVYGHAYYCGMGLGYCEALNASAYTEVQDGYLVPDESETSLTRVFPTAEALAEWLAQQSDLSLSMSEGGDTRLQGNQTLTKKRMLEYLGGLPGSANGKNPG